MNRYKVVALVIDSFIILLLLALVVLLATIIISPGKDAQATVQESDVLVVSDQMCQFKTRTAEWIMVVKTRYQTEEEFWAANPLPIGWRQDIKQVAREIVRGAFLWEGTKEEFVEVVRSSC